MAQENIEIIDRLEKALLSLDRQGIEAILIGNEKESPSQRIESLLVPALENIGKGWEAGRVALSQVYMTGRICEELMDSIFPLHANSGASTPAMAIAALEDFHLLGKRMVFSVLRSGGFDLIGYGQKSLEALVERVKADNIKILLVSTLMLRSALRVRELRSKLDREGLKIKLVVGGAPFRMDRLLWREVGADATSDTAAGAIEIVRKLMGDMP